MLFRSQKGEKKSGGRRLMSRREESCTDEVTMRLWGYEIIKLWGL